MRVFSLIVLPALAGIAFSRNFSIFLQQFHAFAWLVVGHNLLAFCLGYGMARALSLPEADRRAVTMEVGIQNSGLGLLILFTFFPEAGGITLSQRWARRPPTDPVAVTPGHPT